MSLLNRQPVVERYDVHGHTVHVYRADKIGDGVVLPPWGKLIGIDRFLATLDTSRIYYHLSVSPSYSGWALQVLAPHHSLQGKMRIVVTNSKTSASLPTMLANEHLDQPILLRPNMLAVQQSQIKSMAAADNARVLPYGFYTPAYCEGIGSTYDDVCAHVQPKRIVVAAGSGATLAAIAATAYQRDADIEVVGVCCSSIATVQKQLERANEQRPMLVNAPAAIGAPFACNVFWDRRAWHYLVSSCDVSVPTLFWNLGA